MTRLPETAQIIAEVERLSGRKVVVQEDPDLKVMASVKTARGDTPFHVVSYRPGSQATNYLICFQLAFVLRTFTLPEQERWAISSTPAQRQRAMQDLRLTTFPPQLQEFLLNQLMTQLRTFSIGLRVDQWIIDEFPGLAEEQKVATKLQFVDIEGALAPETRNLFPKRLVDANTGMNAAFASFWSSQLGEPRYVLPFHALGYTQVAKDLLNVLNDLPPTPSSDRTLIERWAEILYLSKFFSFVNL